MRYYIPLIALQLYLTFTLLLFQFGPLNFNIENPLLFWFYLFFYQASFFIGYLLASLSKKKKIRGRRKQVLGSDFNVLYFKILIVVALLAAIISFKGVTLSDLINPVYWFDTAMSGIEEPGEQYNKKIERVVESAGSGNKLLNIFFFMIAFSKYLIVPMLVFLWHKVGLVTRLCALFVSFLPVLIALSSGTNKYIFDFAIFYGTSLTVYFLYNYFSMGRFGFRQRKFFLVMVFIAGFGAISFFGEAMKGRGGSIDYIENISPLGDIKIKDYDSISEDSTYYTYLWFTSYLVQGYYGFSLSLSQNFTSTYGFGSSPFLMRQFEWVSGSNLSEMTYQHKVDEWWGETAQWHSFYSHFANDFHFIGVSIVCLVLGFYLARLWISLLDDSNFYAALIMPLFALMIVFIPANNQVFGFLETLSSFWLVSALWFYSMYIKPKRY